MLLIVSDVESLSRSLSRWEWGEYISEAFVIIACAGELIADFEVSWLTEERKKHLQRRSTILLVAALSVSLICLVRTNELSGSVIGSLGDSAKEADRKAKIAITDSSTALAQAKDALTKAGKAADSLGKAEDEANKAHTASSNALALSRGAREEADSFEQDIVSAKKQAADAESHLADALKKAAAATAELDKLKSPRSLTNTPELISALEAFKGTEYRFSGVFGDEESGSLLIQIDGVLEDAGWKRVKSNPPSMEPYMEIRRNNEVIPVRYTIRSGVQISADSSESPIVSSAPLDCRGSVRAPVLEKFTPSVKAAITLGICLSASISPRQEFRGVDLSRVNEPTIVRIDVGKKP